MVSISRRSRSVSMLYAPRCHCMLVISHVLRYASYDGGLAYQAANSAVSMATRIYLRATNVVATQFKCVSWWWMLVCVVMLVPLMLAAQNPFHQGIHAASLAWR